jgi:cell division protease FtsH
MNPKLRTFLVWTALFVVSILVWWAIHSPSHLSYANFLELLNGRSIEQLTIADREVRGELRPAAAKHWGFRSFTLVLPFTPDGSFIDQLRAATVTVHGETAQPWLQAVLLSWLSIMILTGIMVFFILKMQTGGGGNKALSFGKSRASLLNVSGKRVTFKDVAGVEEGKQVLSEIVDFLKEPQKFQRLGGRIPKGVLLKGPPGSGKTLLARAVAGEANVPCFSIAGSSFVEMFVGVGASRVRDLFEQGKKNAPCIIFIDEIDAVGRHRGVGLGGGNDEREQTLNQLLIEMDGFESNEGVILIAATNRPDVLDPALLRFGRFDRQVVVDRPNIKGRLGILKVHTRTIPLDDGVDLSQLAISTPGFSGADLANLVNEAALIAANRDRKKVEREDFDAALTRIRKGIREKLLIEDPEDKWRVAVHEVGHLSASFSFACVEPIDSLSVHTPYRPDWFSHSEPQLPTIVRGSVATGTLTVLLAGRAAEEVFLKDVSSLSANDTALSTALANQMVVRWGLNSNLGLVNDGLLATASGTNDRPGLSDRLGLSDRVQDEVKGLLAQAYEQALGHVEQHALQIVEWASKLFENEILGSSWIQKAREAHGFKSRIALQPGAGKADLIHLKQPIAVEAIDHREHDSHKAMKTAALKRNLSILEMQVAVLGINAPPHIVTQLEDTRAEISRLENDR